MHSLCAKFTISSAVTGFVQRVGSDKAPIPSVLGLVNEVIITLKDSVMSICGDLRVPHFIQARCRRSIFSGTCQCNAMLFPIIDVGINAAIIVAGNQGLASDESNVTAIT